jgi:hypothetical protein
MSDQQVVTAMTRAGKRAGYHLLQALVESLKAVEAVIEELGTIGEDETSQTTETRERIEIE